MPDFDPATATTATTADQALQLAQAWADGRRSWWNLYADASDPNRRGYTMAMCAIADAQEVVKWTALAQALAAPRRAQPDHAVQALEQERDEALGQASWWAYAYKTEKAQRKAADSAARDYERQRDEAAAAARDFVYAIRTLTRRRLESDDPLRLAAADVLARHPSFLPPEAPA